mmetsp:Transcript_42015/g.118806  ORF Transcript_42015/g.118806 Transcript_42015/m.118806 type:complete len:235 (-) Transcript_42015:112-816(-)
MVVPFGGMGHAHDRHEAPIPRVVKEVHAKYWWAVFFLMLAVIVLELWAVRPFDAICTGILAAVVWMQIRSKCAGMSQHCMMCLGIICFIQCVFEAITLFGSLGGRRSASMQKHGDADHQYTVTTSVETHPFFDSSQSFTYNMQSVAFIASPAVMSMASFMSYWSYSAFAAQQRAGNHDPEQTSYGSNHAAIHSIQRNQLQSSLGRQQGTSQAPRFFAGTGHRLDGGPVDAAAAP